MRRMDDGESLDFWASCESPLRPSFSPLCSLWAAAEVTPVRELDRRVIGSGQRGPVTERIQSIYLDAVRGRVDWLAEDITTAGATS